MGSAVPILALVLAALPSGSTGIASPDDAAERPPNIVLIVADDLGHGDAGYLGGRIETPRIDGLARSGVRFDAFYVTPLCTPTRAALLTGRHPFRYGLQVGVVKPWSSGGLARSEETLADRLRGRGYRTHALGKWHLGHGTSELLPTARGFDHHYGNYTGAIDYFTHRRLGRLDWHRDRAPVEESGYVTKLLGDEAVSIIAASEDATPFFLLVSFTAPHTPAAAPPEDLARYADWPAGARTHAAMVSRLDTEIGRILDALEARGIADRTLVVFMSDNGAPRFGHGSNAPFRSGKGHLYEGGVRVPAVVSFPGRIESERRITTPTHVADWMPTLLAFAGEEGAPTKALDGVDLSPLLLSGAQPDRRILLIHLSERGAAVREGSLKLILRDAWEPGSGRAELYDVVADPAEQSDLAAEMPEVVARLRAHALALRAERVPPIERGRREDARPGPVWGPAPSTAPRPPSSGQPSSP